ncbi:MAG: restriction endonuclease [Polyangiaceae bacterium]|nr:restriction endonuclease [Polyangiaceae bacterium]
MNEQVVHHYPPELFQLLVDAIPCLLKGKQAVLDFFKSCGVPEVDYATIQQTVRYDKESINKFEIVKQVLRQINDLGDARLRARREILRRVTQWDDFSLGYDNDRTKAEGYVAKIQKLVNVKDSFTRMSDERNALAAKERQQREQAILEKKRVAEERARIRDRLAVLFAEKDPHARGLQLEKVLNDLFKSFGILVRESFRRYGEAGEGVVEQIDGVIELSSDIYLVEIKWYSDPIGTDKVAPHMVRVFGRGAARGILISASGFTDPAVTMVRESLRQAPFILVELEELMILLEFEQSLSDLLTAKVRAAIVDKNPLFKPNLVAVR